VDGENVRIEESIKKTRIYWLSRYTRIRIMFLNTLDPQKRERVYLVDAYILVWYINEYESGIFFSGIRIKIREIVFNLLEHTKICFDFSDDRFFSFSVFFCGGQWCGTIL